MGDVSTAGAWVRSGLAVLGLAVLIVFPQAGQAQTEQGFGALARVLPEQSVLRDAGPQEVSLRLRLSGGVPWRVFTMKAPDRVVLDFREVDFRGLDPERFDQSAQITRLSAGPLSDGWSRMVLELAGPLVVHQAGLQTDAAGATLSLSLRRSSRSAFDAAAGAPEQTGWDLIADMPAPPPLVPEGKMRVVIDPGHGGIDPGAIRAGHKEADLVLALALQLEEALLRAPGFHPVLTRRDDSFVSLERRVAIAAQAQGHVFLSLHADALEEGVAQGAVVFVLTDSATDKATTALVERHERGALLAGADLSQADDEVAQVLLDLARQDNAQRSLMLAEALVEGIAGQGAQLFKRPLQRAGFSVLKSAEIPSVLIEAGFLSTDAELARLKDPLWRADMAAGIRDGLMLWRQMDRAIAPLRRQ